MKYVRRHRTMSEVYCTCLVNWKRKQKLAITFLVLKTILHVIKTFFVWHSVRTKITLEEHIVDCFDIQFHKEYERINGV